MRLLLDTHIAIWTALQPSALSANERALMTNVRGPIALSAVSIWELRLKWSSFQISGMRKGPIEPDAMLAYAVAVGWDLLPMTSRHAACTLRQPISHKDPFDELLLVQAQEEGLLLLTRDAKLVDHPLAAGIERDLQIV